MHILSPVTDNCSSWISRRGRMAVEMFSWPSLHERMCRTWGSNSGPLACQANSLPIEPPCPGINWFASIQLFHAFVGNSQNYSSLFGRLMHCCPRPSGWEQQYIRSSTAQRERWFWLMPMKAWNSCFISQLVFFYSFLKHKKHSETWKLSIFIYLLNLKMQQMIVLLLNVF